jgi:3-phenylpropionate/trans-cinnamate dioxygenase ferredoxin subunit
MFNYTQLEEEKVEFVEIAPASELPSGERMFVDIGEVPIVIFNISGKLYAIGDICTHDDGPLGDGDIEGFNVVCPRHGAEFDVRTGIVTSMPAVVDIPAYPVQVREGMIFIGVPKEL